MSISACTKTLAKASFSNYNNCVTFAAPGQSILSINGTLSGTSMATPHAVAAVAIYKSYNKNYTLENIIDGLATYCTDLGETGKDEYFGYGFINLSNIVYCSCDCNNCSEILCNGCNCTSCTNCSTYNFLSDDREVASIEIEQPVTRLTYNYGSITNLSDILVNIKYNDNTTKQAKLLELEDLEITGYNPYLYENQTIVVTYKGKSTSFELNIESEYEIGWEYELKEDQTIKLTAFKTTSDMENIILYLPEQINNYTVTEVGENLFYEQSNLAKVVTTTNISQIDENAFYQCSKLKKVELEEGLTIIGNSAFYKCNCIEEITFPNTLKTIGNNAFSNCAVLSTINLQNGINEIGENAFSYTSITTLELPESIEVIKQGTFKGCYSLENIILPESLTTIQSEAFYECSNISELQIPSKVTSISEDAFVKCANLSTITVDSSNTVYNSNNSCNAIIETSTNTLIVGSNNTIIPGTVETIGAYSFDSRISLYSLEIPEGVTTIEENAFANCMNFQAVLIPESVTSIETNSFYNSPYIVLYVYQDSYAHQYAIDNSIEYVLLDNSIVSVTLYNYTNPVYKAFEQVDMDGVTIGAIYGDGSEVYITEGYTIYYQNETDSFRYGDTYFTIYYNQDDIEFAADFAATVEKATPTYTIPTNITGKRGQQLSEIGLPDGFEWMDNSVVLEETGNITYNAKYIPEDIDNYKIVENIEITIEVLPNIAIIQGKIITENLQGKHIAVVTVYKTNDLRDEVSSSTENAREVISQIETNEDGSFFIEVTDMEEYDIVITKSGYLEYRVIGIGVIDGETIQLEQYKLIGGDLVADGEIEIDDLVLMNENCGVSITEENKIFDLNEDGVIDVLDRNILKSNYGK